MFLVESTNRGERHVSDWAEVAEQVGKMGNFPNLSQPKSVANLMLPSVVINKITFGQRFAKN